MASIPVRRCRVEFVVIGCDKVEESETLIGRVRHDDGEGMNSIAVEASVLRDWIGCRGVAVAIKSSSFSYWGKLIRCSVANMNVSVEDVHPMDARIRPAAVSVHRRARIGVLIVRVGEEALLVERFRAIEIVGHFVQAAGVAQTVSPVVNHAVKRALVGRNLVVMRSVVVGADVLVVEVVPVVIFRVAIIALVAPLLRVDGVGVVVVVVHIDQTRRMHIVTKVLEGA